MIEICHFYSMYTDVCSIGMKDMALNGRFNVRWLFRSMGWHWFWIAGGQLGVIL
jgi:hypothetical protein